MTAMSQPPQAAAQYRPSLSFPFSDISFPTCL
jgi:hypothetical protein